MPEFGTVVSWAMCRNCMCPNFGMHYLGPAPVDGSTVSDDRYLLNSTDGKCELTCQHCESKAALNSNRAIRRLARHFLAQSIPFAACDKPDCENHGRNAFEHAPWTKGDSDAPYTRHGTDHRMACRKCPGRSTRLALGSKLYKPALPGSPSARDKAEHARRVRKRKRHLRNVLRGALYYRSLWMIEEDFGIGAKKYLGSIVRLGNCIRDYLAWRNAHLLSPEFAKRAEPIRVHSDAMTATLQREGLGDRHSPLRIPVSSVSLRKDRTYYILAAHAGFAPEEDFDVSDVNLHQEARRPWESEWDFLDHPGKFDRNQSTKERLASLTDEGALRGMLTVRAYTDLAHFLVLRKMLSRFQKVHLHLDAERVQSDAALVAFAADIRAGRCEVALCQKKEGGQAVERKRRPPRSKPAKVEGFLKDELDSAWLDMAARHELHMKKANDEADLLAGLEVGESKESTLVGAFAEAPTGANSVNGGWAWLDFPPAGPRFDGANTLWLTERPGATYESDGRDLLWAAGVLPADWAHARLRDNVRAFHRPDLRADPGRSFRRSTQDPRVLMAEMWLGLFKLNYWRRRPAGERAGDGGEPRRPPAWSMGLGRPKEDLKRDMVDAAWNFRLGVRNAEKMAKWL